MLDEFNTYLIDEGKSKNTIESYIRHIQGFLKWFNESFGESFERLYRMNILDYKSFLLNCFRQPNLTETFSLN